MGDSKPIVLLGEAEGANKTKIGKGLVGPSGVKLLRMLSEAGAIELTSSARDYISNYYSTGDPNQLDMVWNLHSEFHRANVFNLHPQGNAIESLCGDKSDSLPGYPKLSSKSPGYLRSEFASQLERLGDEIISLDPNLIVCLGNTPLWALAGRTGISKLRGTTCVSTHTVSGYKLLCAYHPAAVIRQWELRPTTIIDLGKITHEGGFAKLQRPRCEIWIEPEIEDIRRFINDFIIGCKILSVDIETAGQQITCIGFAPRIDLAIVIPIHDFRRKSGSYWTSIEDERLCWRLIRSVLEDQSIAKVFQNGLYDIAFLWRAYGIKVMGASEDTMLLHHALQPESLKGLGFLGSVYTNHGAWKSERKGIETTIKRDA